MTKPRIRRIGQFIHQEPWDPCTVYKSASTKLTLMQLQAKHRLTQVDRSGRASLHGNLLTAHAFAQEPKKAVVKTLPCVRVSCFCWYVVAWSSQKETVDSHSCSWKRHNAVLLYSHLLAKFYVAVQLTEEMGMRQRFDDMSVTVRASLEEPADRRHGSWRITYYSRLIEFLRTSISASVPVIAVPATIIRSIPSTPVPSLAKQFNNT